MNAQFLIEKRNKKSANYTIIDAQNATSNFHIGFSPLIILRVVEEKKNEIEKLPVCLTFHMKS